MAARTINTPYGPAVRITAHELHTQVVNFCDSLAGRWDVDGLTAALRGRWGNVRVCDMQYQDDFWALVGRFDLREAPVTA